MLMPEGSYDLPQNVQVGFLWRREQSTVEALNAALVNLKHTFNDESRVVPPQ